MGQSSAQYVYEAPTTDQIKLNEDADLRDISSQPPSSQGIDFGGLGKLKTVRLRGARPNETGVFLEGIRLNSPASGEFDLSTLNPSGLSSPTILRGTFGPSASSASGQIHYRLPNDPQWSSRLTAGSFGYSAFSQESPFGSVSIEQAKNDFAYTNDQGEKARRENNETQVINARAFYRTAKTQIWTQTLFSDLELPGSVNFPTERADSTSLNQTLAYQGRVDDWSWSLWGQYQDVRYRDQDTPLNTHNQIWHSGLSASHLYIPAETAVSFENRFWFTQDYLSSESVDSPVRWRTAWSGSLIWKTTYGILNPRLKLEYLSDLQQKLSAQPEVGGRHPLYQDQNRRRRLETFWNLSLSYRAPNFLELYFESPPSIPNPDLGRQKTYQADLGFEYSEASIDVKQVFFTQRTTSLLGSKVTNEDQFQVVNRGTLVSLGSESSAHVRPRAWLSTSIAYTWNQARVGGDQRSFQPIHQTRFYPELNWQERFWFALPLSVHSSVKTTSEDLNWQWDLQAIAKFEWKAIKLQAQVFNLLFWDRIAVPGYPLPNRPWFRTSLQYRW